ncbi:MAG TPA: undecaprenyl-diphosphate phosphatase [Dehalococcoidia bacterium]|nr:undecaprenyl-diphosphate phosphatase [Dehalococcoidia bacterium]
MEVWQAIILGVVQGLTEFMPISSSAHLIVVPRLFGWPDPGLSFDVALHLGTLLAVLIYFWSDLVGLAIGWVQSLRYRSLEPANARLAWLIILGSIPAGLAGLLLEDVVETTFRDPRLIGVTLIALGVVLYAAERLGRGARTMEEIGWRDSLWIGVAQAFALVPGVSRSGSTLTAGLFRGLKRDTAARFSFLLGTPVIVAAGGLQAYRVLQKGLAPAEQLSFAAGIVASGVVGYLTIAFLLRFLRTRSTMPFIAYRISLGIFLLSWVASGQ